MCAQLAEYPRIHARTRKLRAHAVRQPMKLTSVGRSTSSSETDEKSNSDPSALIQYAPEINVEAVVSKMQDAFCRRKTSCHYQKCRVRQPIGFMLSSGRSRRECFQPGGSSGNIRLHRQRCIRHEDH